MPVKLLCGALAASLPAFAHEGEPVAPHDAIAAWSFDPAIVISLIIAAVLFARGDRPGHGISRGRRWAFWSGWCWLAVALISPVHATGGALFSAHMLQHEILMLVAAPLLALSRPLAPSLWALPVSWRRAAGRAAKSAWMAKPWRWLTNPFISWTLHFFALWVWHAPLLFDATVKNDLVHSLQHISFLGSALLFWWALLHGREHRLGYGAAVVYVFLTGVHNSILGALLTFAPSAWYAPYFNTAPLWGLTPLEDQQIGGLIMWVPAGIVYIAAGLWFVMAWMRESELRVLRREDSYAD